MSEHNFLPSNESLICPIILIHEPLGSRFLSHKGREGSPKQPLRLLSLSRNTRNRSDGSDRQSRCRGRRPDTFREEGLYAFRFDLNDDAREEVTFKIRFGEATHGAGDEHRHVQSFEVRRATGDLAPRGAEGDLLVEGRTGQVAMTESGIRAFAGLAPDLFAGDAAALGLFRNALYKQDKFAAEAFHNHQNFFAGRNVTVIVLEVPCQLIGRGQVRAWATVSLYGHAPEVQVSRWGLPLITNIFMPDMDMREDYNRAVPADDVPRFSSQISKIVEKVTQLAGSVTNSADYARQFIARICPTTLPYALDSDAAFVVAGFNGRGLADDVMDVMLALTTNTALGDGVAPDQRHMQAEFPYFGESYASTQQVAFPAQGSEKK